MPNLLWGRSLAPREQAFQPPALDELFVEARDVPESSHSHSRNSTRNERIPNLFGPYWQELRSLSQERDSEMFFAGLFQLGQRLEADDRIEAAGAVYQAIVQASPPLPGPPPQGGRGLVGEGPSSFFPSPLVGEGARRAGEGDSVLQSIRSRAQQRLAVLNGGGPSGLHSEYLLRRLSKETLEPTTLFGFGLASVGLRTVRLATLSRLAATPTANALTRGFGAQATAGIFGMTAEAALFPVAVRGAALALGRDLDWSYPQLGKELASSFLLLGAMRLTNLGVRPWLATRPNGLLQQGSLFAGIGLGLHLETMAGLRHPTDKSTWLIDSLATWAQVNVAGRVVHGVLGEGFVRMERTLDAFAEAMGRANGGRGHDIRQWFGENFGSRSELLAGTTGAGRSPTGFRPTRADLPSLPLAQMASSEGNRGGGGPGGGRRDATLPFGVPLADLVVGDFPEGKNPERVTSFAQLRRRIGDPELKFKEALEKDHVYFRLAEAFPENAEEELREIQRRLDGLTRDSEVKIIFTRRVMITSEATGQRAVFIKGLKEGFQLHLTTDPLFVAGSAPGSAAQEVASRRESPLEENPAVPLATDVKGLPLMIRAGALGRRGGELLVVVEGRGISVAELETATRDLGGTWRPELRLRILSIENEKTFLGSRGENQLAWKETPDSTWEKIRAQRIFNRLVLYSPEELYRQIRTYAQDPTRAPDAAVAIRLKGAPENLDALVQMITRALNLYRPAGKSLALEIQEGEVPVASLSWENVEGEWGRVGTPLPAVQVPPSAQTKTRAQPSAPRTGKTPKLPAESDFPLESQEIPMIQTLGIRSLPNLLRQALQGRAGNPRPLILVADKLGGEQQTLSGMDVAALNEASSKLGAELPAGAVFPLLLGLPHRAFVGTASPVLTWKEVPLPPRSETGPEVLAAFRSPLELHLYLAGLPQRQGLNERELSRQGKTPSVYAAEWKGPLPLTNDLKQFIWQSLTTLEVYAKKFILHLGSTGEHLTLESVRGDLWIRPQSAESAPEPAGTPREAIDSQTEEGTFSERASEHFSQVEHRLREARMRHKRPSPAPSTGVRSAAATEEAASESNWVTIRNNSELWKVLKRPARTGGTEIINVRMFLPNEFNEVEVESLELLLGKSFPSNRVVYLYDMNRQRGYRIMSLDERAKIQEVKFEVENL